VPEEKPKSRPIVPIEYAGMYIVWNRDQTRIVASGRTLEDALRAAKEAGEEDPVLAKVPKAHVRSVGAICP
jgi:Family of unknown function (DUF5678)